MNISLPDSLRAFIESRVAEGAYSSASEYFRELVRKDKHERAQDHLEKLLLDGVNSGPATEMNREDWKEIRKEVLARVRSRGTRRRKSS